MSDQRRRPLHSPPELLEANPLPPALHLAEWGAGLGGGLRWLTPPPKQALLESRKLLGELGALDRDGRITAHGSDMARLGIHPRSRPRAAERQHGGESARRLLTGPPCSVSKTPFWRPAWNGWSSLAKIVADRHFTTSAGELVAMAYPERRPYADEARGHAF